MLTDLEPKSTRAFTWKGGTIKVAEAGLPSRTVLGRDIKDIRRLFGSKYDDGIRGLLDYYRTNHPNLMKRKGPQEYVCDKK